MAGIPSFATYTQDEIEAASQWPAVSRYARLVTRKPTTSLAELKHRRHVAWLECALALFHHRADDRAICSAWSKAADRNLRDAAQLSGLSNYPVALFALGKLGAEELNLSSDVDVILVAQDETPVPIKEAREFVRILSEIDDWGFCHRVDMTIRPGGPSASLIPTVSQFENHYGYHGEAWERLAFVRLREIQIGDGKSSEIELERTSVSSEVLSFASRFSFRRHLDYSVFEELRILIHRIRSEHNSKNDKEIHLKLHPGCIRDLELFVHAMQTIHGGRRKDLVVRRTDEAIGRLAEAGLITKTEKEKLNEAYWTFRGIENRLQVLNDEQTYRVSDLADLNQIESLSKAVLTISEAGFPAINSGAVPNVETLVARGFSADVATESLEELQQTKVLSRKSERDEREKNLFLSGFLSALETSGGDLDLGLRLLVDFVKSMRAKATLFSMLNREQALVQQLAILFGVSPWAGSILCSRPELLDSFILRQDINVMDEFLSKGDSAAAFESLSERKLMGELIAIQHFLQTRDLEACTENLTTLADTIATDLMKITATETGCEPLGIVALGKWGGREMGFRSDLDFVFVTDGSPGADQQRLARRFLNRMTEAHRGGSIYSVDLRLRPSGHAGPILVQVDSLVLHLRDKAEAWERQSWLRARSLAGLPHILPLEVRHTILKRGLTRDDRAALTDIANRLFKSRPTLGEKTPIDLKLVQGGLAPIEFAAQIGILQTGLSPSSTIGSTNGIDLETSTRSMLHFLEGHASENSLDWRRLGPRLRESHQWLRGLEQASRITDDVAGSSLKPESKEFRRLAKSLGDEPASLTEKLLKTLEESELRLSTLLGR